MSNRSQIDKRALRGESPPCAREVQLEWLIAQIRRYADSHPSAPAVRTGQLIYSYGSLVTHVTRLADRLSGRGIGAGSRVGLLCRHGFEAVVAMLATLETGAAYVPLDPNHPASYLEFLIGDSRPACLLIHGSLLEQLPALIRGAGVGTPVEDLDLTEIPVEACFDTRLARKPHPQDLAYVIYTSGSTGRPKGVMVPREGLANYLAWSAEAYDNPAWSEALVGSSLAVDLTITGLFAPLLRGACVVMLPAGDAVDRWVHGLRDTAASCLIKTTPTQLKLLMPQLMPEDAGRVAVLVVGGEALEWQTIRQWRRLAPHTRIFNEYGPTETVVGCTVQDVAELEIETQRVPIGRPIGNTCVHVLTASFGQCARGETGELHIGGAGVAHGYLGRPGLTAAHFVPDAYGQPGARLYRSGDLVRWNGDTLEFLGRRDNQLKISGYRVEPGEVECTLLEFRDVRAAAVVLETGLGASEAAESTALSPGVERYPDIRRFSKPEATEATLVAYLVFENDAPSPTYVELRQWLKARLSAHLVPGAFVRVGCMPLLASGKVDRKALVRSLGREISPSASGDLPRNAVEEVLCGVVCDALGLAAVGIHDNFFDVGGDSIRVITIHAAARARGLTLELADFFKHQTIAELAACEAGRLGRGRIPEAVRKPFSLISASDRAALPAGIENAYPLARMQAGLIFHSYESRNSANYHDVFVYQIRSEFDERHLADALKNVVERHPALRTSFALSGYSEPLQLVWRTVEAEFRTNDLRELDAERQHRALMDWIAGEKHRPFDFETAPLLRLHVHRTANDVAHWGISFHDSILDGWSVATFLVELITEYAGRLAGKPAIEPALTTKYEAFVRSEREALRDPSQRAFWTKYLKGRSAAMSSFGEVTAAEHPYLLEVNLTTELSESLQSVGRLLRVSVKHVLLAAHVHVVGLMSGQVDVVTGVESHGRVEAEDGDRVLGMHLNTVPLRMQLRGGTWAELIEETHDAERSIFPYRRYPYASIHKEQAGGDLFTTVFNYTHFHRLREIAGLPGIEPIGGCGFGQRHYGLSAEFNQDPFTNHLRLDLECNLGAGNVEHWNRVKGAYEAALHAIAADPMGRYDQVGITECYTAPQSTIRPETLPTVVAQWLDQVRDQPHALAVIDERRETTYGELYDEACSIGQRLRSAGVRAEECVAIYLHRGVEQIAAVWGVLAIGATYLVIEPDASQSRCRHILHDAAVKFVISTQRLQDSWDLSVQAPPQLHWLVLREEKPAPGSNSSFDAQVRPEQLAYITYTSGSTGAPKGVRVTHRNLSYSTAARPLHYAEPVERFLLIPSLAYDSAVAVVYWTLCTGGTLVIPSEGDTRDPGRLIDLVERYEVTHWLSVPALYEAVLRQALPESLRSLRCAIVAGEACPASVAAVHHAKCKADLFNEYGPSEGTVWATVSKVREPVTGSTVPIGLPIEGGRVYVLDYHLRPVAPGVVGEIYLGGPGVSRGYGAAALTAERFVPDPFAEQPGQRMYRTGDLARRVEREELEFAGRADRQVKIRGYRVEPAEIEHVMRRVTGVRDVAVVPIDAADDNGLRLIAYVVPEEAPLEVSTLKLVCAQSLPPPLVPANFIFVDQLPRSENGKVDVLYLANMRPGLLDNDAVDRVLARIEAMPANEVNVLLRELAVGRS